MSRLLLNTCSTAAPCTRHLHLLPACVCVCVCAAVCGMRRVQQVNYRCAQLALGRAINSAGCSIRTATQFNECANIGYLKVCVCVCVCAYACCWACKSFAGKGWATIWLRNFVRVCCWTYCLNSCLTPMLVSEFRKEVAKAVNQWRSCQVQHATWDLSLLHLAALKSDNMWQLVLKSKLQFALSKSKSL